MNIAALIAGLLAGIIGAMGLGGGAVLIIYLAVFTSMEQLTAQGINLIFFLPIGTLAVIVYAIKKQIKWRLTLCVAAGGIVGAFIGITLTDTLGGSLTSKLFGFLLLALGVKEIFTKKQNSTCKK